MCRLQNQLALSSTLAVRSAADTWIECHQVRSVQEQLALLLDWLGVERVSSKRTFQRITDRGEDLTGRVRHPIVTDRNREAGVGIGPAN